MEITPAVGEAFEIKASHKIIAECETDRSSVVVVLDEAGMYQVVRDGVLRHPNCTAENVMTALAFYLHSALYRAEKLEDQAATPSL